MTYIRNNNIDFMCGQTVCYTLESCYNSLPQIPLFLYVFLSTYSRMYTGKILSLVRKALGCFEFNWE